MKKGRLLKTAAFLLASLMLLSACQSGGGAPGKESSAAAGSSASQADTADKPEAWIADGVTLRLVRADNPSQPMTTDNLIIEEIKKRTGIEISVEAIPGADFAEKQKTMIMTNNMPDILYDTYDVPDYAPNGVFAPVSDYLDVMPNFSALLEATPEFKKLYIGDKLYYLPVMGRDIYRFGRSPMIRQDYLDETGLETPKNFEELHAVLKAVKEKHPDVYPLANRNGTGNLLTCFAYSMGSGYDVYFDPDVDGGKYVYGQANESFVPVMQFWQICTPTACWIRTMLWQQRRSGRKSSRRDAPHSSSTTPPLRLTSIRRWPQRTAAQNLLRWKFPSMPPASAAASSMTRTTEEPRRFQPLPSMWKKP